MTAAVPLNVRLRRTSVALAVTSAFLTVCVLGSGVAGAAPASPAAASVATWAYGGENSTHGSGTIGLANITWSASIGTAVIFNATPNGPNVTEVQTERTVGVSLSISATGKRGTVQFEYRASEAVDAFANVTNASSVDEQGVWVPALGIENAAVHGTAALAESLVAHGVGGKSASAYLNASGKASSQVTFKPALGVVPLKLAGDTEWNSTALATPSATWNFSYAYAFHGWNNTTKTGGSARTGTWSTSGTVNLTGTAVTLGLPAFKDHAERIGVILTVQGPAELYDGFVVIPRGFDVFSGATHDYDSESMSNVSISGEALYLDVGRARAGAFTASKLVVGRAAGKVPLLVSPATPEPAASAIQGNVVAQPESVSAAEGQAHCLEVVCPGAGPSVPLRLIVASGVGLVVAAVLAAAVVVRRRPPATVYPNSALYPPGAAAASSPRPAPAPKPAEDDPLGHLW